MASPMQDVTDFLKEFVDNVRLVGRLAMDTRVPTWLKVIIPTVVAVYVLSPVDVIPDIIPGLGQLDDLAVIVLGIKLFIDMSPPDVVRQHLNALRSLGSTSYRVITEEPAAKPKEKPAGEPAGEPGGEPGDYIEATYTVKDK